jgi:hypothetical protein
MTKYATPTDTMPPTEKPSSKESQASQAAELESECLDSEDELFDNPTTGVFPDITHENIVWLIQDLLYMTELTGATSKGDFSRIEDILPDLACIFWGAGSNNYSTEILHLLFNIKEVWTPQFVCVTVYLTPLIYLSFDLPFDSNAVQDMMLVNISGLPGHTMAIDLNIEHLIGSLKALFALKGIYANWDWLGNLSAAINHLQKIKT